MRTQRDWPQRHCARDASFAPLRDGCPCNDEEPPIIPKDCTRKPLPPVIVESLCNLRYSKIEHPQIPGKKKERKSKRKEEEALSPPVVVVKKPKIQPDRHAKKFAHLR